jgi:hypothetical protein
MWKFSRRKEGIETWGNLFIEILEVKVSSIAKSNVADKSSKKQLEKHKLYEIYTY